LNTPSLTYPEGMDILVTLTGVAALGAGLMAGLFFAFSVFIMKALRRIPAAHGISAMQSINVSVMTPLFALAFFGTAVVSSVLVVMALTSWERTASVYLVAGGLLYLAGGIIVTLVCNVPRNNALAKADPASAEGARLWQRYLIDWTRWNHVRTVLCVAAAASFGGALYLLGAESATSM
jgi:uncharacterized membrane protein